MAKKTAAPKERKIGKQEIAKKTGMDPKIKSRIYTIIVLVVLLIFFIVNNTRDEPKEGPYPPNYSPDKSLQSE